MVKPPPRQPTTATSIGLDLNLIVHVLLKGAVNESLNFFFPNRCTLLEPGPVSSAVGEANTERTKNVDLTTADQKTREIWQGMLGRLGGIFIPEVVLTPQAIAEAVKEIILSENPDFRYHTNKGFYTEEIAAKFADATGYKSVDLITQKFCPEK